MFSGIIESIGIVHDITDKGTNKVFTIEHTYGDELYIDQSISHNGVCLTIIKLEDKLYQVEAILETLNKSNLGSLVVGEKVNLERCLLPHTRLDGHIVQGHVDQTGVCTSVTEENGSWIFSFSYDSKLNNITIEKGSITINGTSLTVVDSKKDTFSVAIIPYTYEHTNFNTFKKGTVVNLEFDVLGKYVSKLVSLKN